MHARARLLSEVTRQPNEALTVAAFTRALGGFYRRGSASVIILPDLMVLSRYVFRHFVRPLVSLPMRRRARFYHCSTQNIEAGVPARHRRLLAGLLMRVAPNYRQPARHGAVALGRIARSAA